MSDLFEINHRLTFDLWHIKNVKGSPHELSSRLILPQTRFGQIRLCEQEAKTLYCSVLNNLNYYYSMETPTTETYTQKGKTPQSGNTDMSLYTDTFQSGNHKFSKVTNVEFKAGKPGKEFIRKDIEKLLREKLQGSWVHILEKISDTKYLNKLLDDFIASFDNCKNQQYLVNLNHNEKKVEEVSIVFYFYSVRERWACMKHFYFNKFSYDGIEAAFMNYVRKFFSIDYNVKVIRNNDGSDYYFIDVLAPNDWIILSFKDYRDHIFHP